MRQLQDIKKLLPSVLEGGDILLIVPPFAVKDYSILGLHILQTIAERIGYKVEVLYANVLLAAIIGEDVYDKISLTAFNLRWMKLGERLFSRSAHGMPPLGKSSRAAADEELCIGTRRDRARVSYQPVDFDRAGLLKLEEICFSFVNEILRVITPMDYKMIGCTTMLEQNNCSAAILKGIKKNRPGIITLLGGSNCDGEMAEGIASLSGAIDYIFSGESESSFREFLTGYSRGKLPSRRILTGEPLKDLNTLPLADYENFIKQMRHFYGENLPGQIVISYETSRGCWRGQQKKCSFCGVESNTLVFRQKSEEKVIKDLELIARRYPAVTGILMTDNIVPHSYYKKLLPFLSRKKGFPSIWYQENTGLKLKDLVNLKEARIKSVLFGIDSLSPGLLKLMNKGVTAGQNLSVLRNAQSVGIYIIWFMLWGFPGDKVAHYEEILKLLPLIRHLQPPRELLHLKLVRFSSYVENPRLHQITNLRPMEIHKKIYPHWANTDKLAYEFTGDYPCQAHENPGLIREIYNEIETWQKTWEKKKLVMKYFMNTYVIYDNRDIHTKGTTHILDYPRAREVMVYCDYRESETQKWAVEQKLGVILDSRYVPLVTASPELLAEFEENRQP